MVVIKWIATTQKQSGRSILEKSEVKGPYGASEWGNKPAEHNIHTLFGVDGLDLEVSGQGLRIYAMDVDRFLNELLNAGVIDPVVEIEGRSLTCHAAYAARAARKRAIAIDKAINALKATRSWLKDARLAAIRRELEEALSSR